MLYLVIIYGRLNRSSNSRKALSLWLIFLVAGLLCFALCALVLHYLMGIPVTDVRLGHAGASAPAGAAPSP